jgi:glycosyltransferase involved in cell wall biosynthesis
VTADVLLRGQLAFLREAGFDVTVIASPGEALERVGKREGVRTVGVEMARDPAPRKDAASLVALIGALREIGPDVVIASTPKAGLLGMMAARVLAVPVRVYLLRGLRLETETGPRRTILGMAERLASACAHDVVCVSESLRRAYVEAGYAPRGKTRALGAGSSNGVDIQRFDAPARRGEAAALRESLALHGRTVIGFIGRIAGDKGIADLLSALEELRRERPDIVLLIVGVDFAGDVDAGISARLRDAGDAVRCVAHVADTAPYYPLMTVLGFPSRREGFPNVPLEAAASCVPTVGYRVTGVTDAVVDGSTGTLVERGDVAGLTRALLGYLTDPALAARHGRAARERVVEHFQRERVWNAWQTWLSDRTSYTERAR